MNEHDTSYTLLFSHKRMVRDLLTGFSPPALVANLDLDSLEKVSGGDVTDNPHDRHGDLVWRVRWGEDWLYLYLLLDFPLSIDRFMAMRVLLYTGLLYQDLIRRGETNAGRCLPPILPVLFYSGDHRQRATAEVRASMQPPPEGRERVRSDQGFLLIDDAAYAIHPKDSLTNLVAPLFRLEPHQSCEEVAVFLERLIKWLDGPEQAGLRRTYLLWLHRRLPRWFPGETFPELHDLREAYEMITNHFEEWKKRRRTTGMDDLSPDAF